MNNLKQRLAMSHGMNARLCHQALDMIKELEKKITLLEEEATGKTITAEIFKNATGRDPENDDLERVNCSRRGPGHFSCGWCNQCNSPMFECRGTHAI